MVPSRRNETQTPSETRKIHTRKLYALALAFR